MFYVSQVPRIFSLSPRMDFRFINNSLKQSKLSTKTFFSHMRIQFLKVQSALSKNRRLGTLFKCIIQLKNNEFQRTFCPVFFLTFRKDFFIDCISTSSLFSSNNFCISIRRCAKNPVEEDGKPTF